MPDNETLPPDEYPLCDFLDDLRDITALPTGRRYCFVLGSGASVPSGIPTGEILATNWIRDLFKRRHPDRPADGFEPWATEENLGLPGFTYANRAGHYGQLYKLRFSKDPSLGQDYLREKLRPVSVSFGYSVLARILATKDHRLVITTNFDHLTEDALKRYTAVEPLVCGHEQLAEYLVKGNHGPVIAKIHGDLFLKTYNTEDDLADLREQWKTPLTSVFRNFTPIFLGYGGNDPGFMKFLTEGLPKGTFSHPPIWTYRPKPSAGDVCGRPKNPRIREFMSRHGGRYLAIPGFDEFMLLLGDVFGLPKLDKEMEAEAASRLKTYRDELDKTVASLKKANALPGSPQLPEWAGMALERMLGEKVRRDWHEWHLAAINASTPAKTKAIYTEALTALPESAPLKACFAGYLASQNPGDTKALETAQQALTEAEKTYGHDHPDTIMAARQLGRVHYFRGDYAAAEPLYRRAMETSERVLGPEHPDTLHSLNNLAILLAAMGDHAAAEPLYRRALETRERVIGPEHPDTLHSLNNLASLLNCKGDRVAAERLNRRAFETRERVLGPDHPDTLQSLNNLATLLADNGDRAAAEPLYRRALETRERVLGPEHPKTLSSLNNLANFLAENGDRTAAEPLYLRAVETSERVLGSEHPTTKLYRSNLVIFQAGG